MITTVTQENMVALPAEISQAFGIKPGWRLDRQPIEGRNEILVRLIPDRGDLARQLLGAGRKFSPERDSVAELIAEREATLFSGRHAIAAAEGPDGSLASEPQKPA